MTDEQAKEKTNAKIDRLYAQGAALVKESMTMPEGDESGLTKERGRRIFLAGMDVSTRATARSMKIEKSKLKHQPITTENMTTQQQEVSHYLSKLRSS